MKRGKRFLENENTFIYVGTTIFILLAVVIGIIMYITTNSDVKIEGNVSKKQEITENVTSDIGKTVEQSQETTNTSEETKSEEVEAAEQNVENPEVIPEVTAHAEASVENKKNETQPVNNGPKAEESKTQMENESAAGNEETKKEITFSKPAEGEIICEYAKDNLIYSETLKEWITHTAIDIKVDKTSVIKSAADGVIKTIINDPRYGLTVVISHNEGYETVYSNLLTAEFVVVGEEVEQGQTIGTAGNTAAFESNMGCHLHFELLKDGEYLNPAIFIK